MREQERVGPDTISRRESGVLDIFDLRLDGSERRLTFARSDDAYPEWAPDGSAFAFVTMRWTRLGRYDLAVYDVRTKQVRRLTGPDDDTDVEPMWSPDGSRIAFMRTSMTGQPRALCVMESVGGPARCIPPVNGVLLGVRRWADAHRLLVWVDRSGLDVLLLVDAESRAESVISSGGQPERWTGGLASKWIAFGEPKPEVGSSEIFGRAFRQTGDGAFWSGAYTAHAYDVRGGLWVEAEFSVPLTAPPGPSQDQLVSLFAFADTARWTTWDHATADFPPARHCQIRYPASAAHAASGAGSEGHGRVLRPPSDD